MKTKSNMTVNKPKELDWEKEFWKIIEDYEEFAECHIDTALCGELKDFIQSLFSTQRQEVLDEVLKTIGKVKYYKCKDTNSIDYGEMIPCERIDIDELRKAIKSLKQK